MILTAILVLIVYSLIYRVYHAIFAPTYPTRQEALKAILEKQYGLPVSEYREHHAGYDDSQFWDLIDQKVFRIMNGLEKMPL